MIRFLSEIQGKHTKLGKIVKISISFNRLVFPLKFNRFSQPLTLILLLPPTNEVCEGKVFTGVCLSTGGSLSREGGESLSRGISVQGVSAQVALSRGSLYMGSLSRGRGSLSRGGSLCPGEGVCVQGRESLSRGGGLCPGGLCQGDPHTIKSGHYASYWNIFLFNNSFPCLTC